MHVTLLALCCFCQIALSAGGARAQSAVVTATREPLHGPSRALAMLRARIEYERAAIEYGRSRELHQRRMLSDSELEARRLDADRARMSYWEELVVAARGASHVMIERAARRRGPDGRASVRITIRNAGGSVGSDLAPPGAADDPLGEDAMRRALLGGELTDLFVSLKADPGANGTTISSPYERRIGRLRRGQATTVSFTLFRDVAEVVVSVRVGDDLEERRVFLDRDGSGARFAVQSTQLSQEADLGAQALFDLRIQRLGAEGAARLAVDSLPPGVAAEFRDPDSKARLTQIRFQEGDDERRLQLALTLPQRSGGAVRADLPIHFAVLATDATADDTTGRATSAGRIGLEVVPRGLPRVELRALNLYHEVAAGDSVVTEVVVRNSGSRRLDDLRLHAEPPPGWRADFTPAALGARAVDAEHSVRLVVRPPADAAVGDYEARVRVESAAADRRLETEDKVLRLHVPDRGTPIGSVAILVALVAIVGTVMRMSRRWVTR
jgi:hypothetical protein